MITPVTVETTQSERLLDGLGQLLTYSGLGDYSLICYDEQDRFFIKAVPAHDIHSTHSAEFNRERGNSLRPVFTQTLNRAMGLPSTSPTVGLLGRVEQHLMSANPHADLLVGYDHYSDVQGYWALQTQRGGLSGAAVRDNAPDRKRNTLAEAISAAIRWHNSQLHRQKITLTT